MDESGIYKNGTIIDGRYRIERRLGRGGFATVYEALHLQLDRPAALKVLEPVAPQISERFQARFMTEARIAANLDHPNVVRIFDFGVIEPDGRPYIAMEKLEGRDLEEHLQQYGPMEPKRAKRLFEGVLDALRIGHERGIVHKDLKPSNLFMVKADTPDERLVVLDYGIARLEGDNNPRYTEEGQYTGTPAYMPPEYIQRREVSPAYDVYQIGLIFIEMMTGQPVISGESNIACMVAHIEGKHRVPDNFGDTPLGATMLKAIAVDPTERYVDAGQMLDAVRIARVDTNTDFTMAAVELTPDQEQRISREHGDRQQPQSQQPEQRHAQQGQHPPYEPKKKSRAPLYIVLGLVLTSMMCIGVTAILFMFVAVSDGDGFEDTISFQTPGVDPIKVDIPNIETPTTPSITIPDAPNMPGSVADADQIYSYVLAAYMVDTVLMQVELFESSYRRSKGWDKNPSWIFTPTGTNDLLQVARDQIDRGLEGPRRPDLETAVKEMRRDLKPFGKTVEDLNDYHAVRKQWQQDKGEAGEELAKKMRKQQSALKRSFRPFKREVSSTLRTFLKDRAKQYESTDPFLYRASKAMSAAESAIRTTSSGPGSKTALKTLERLDREIQDLENYADDHADDLQARYKMSAGIHTRYISSLKDTLKQGNELHAEAKKGEKPNTQFLKMQMHMNLQAYNLCLRW